MRTQSGVGSDAVRRIRHILLIESLLVLGSAIAGYLLHWRIPLPVWLAVPAGLILWAGGLFFTLRLRRRRAERRGREMRGRSRKGYPLVEARGGMHLGAAIGFRLWPNLAESLGEARIIHPTVAASP